MVTVKGQVCVEPYLAGPSCATPYFPAVNSMTEIAVPGVYKYYKCMSLFVSN